MKPILAKFQKFINYQFNDENLLIQALTTPQFGNEINSPSYEYLETLGDAVIKLIFILRMRELGIEDPGEITKLKASLENDETLRKIATSINLDQFIFKSEKQNIEGTRILADVFEAICGAIFLDSNYNIKLIEENIIRRYFKDLISLSKDSKILNKNILLEFLQDKFKRNISIKLDFEKRGPEHDPIWIAKNPQILDKSAKKELVELPVDLQSDKFGKKKDAEKDIYLKILDHLKTISKQI